MNKGNKWSAYLLMRRITCGGKWFETKKTRILANQHVIMIALHVILSKEGNEVEE